MTDRLLVANLCFFAADGHNHYRVHAPARAGGVAAVDCDLYHRGAPWLAAHADVLVLHGLNPEWEPVVRGRRARGRVTLFEASDHYLDIQPWSGYSAGWLDRSLQDLFWQTVAAVDAVQTSTDALAAVLAPHARRVFVFPNPVDPIPPLPRPADRPVTAGWAGSGTHLADWAAAAPAVERWVAGHPSARLAVMTDDRARDLVRLPPDRYTFTRPGPLAAYHAFLRGLDVGFVPLLRGPFDAGRTDPKFQD